MGRAERDEGMLPPQVGHASEPRQAQRGLQLGQPLLEQLGARQQIEGRLCAHAAGARMQAGVAACVGMAVLAIVRLREVRMLRVRAI